MHSQKVTRGLSKNFDRQDVVVPQARDHTCSMSSVWGTTTTQDIGTFYNAINFMKKWLVYILRCRDDTLYTGITNDLENRLQSHNEKRGARYTRTRLPVTLVYQEEALSRSLASRREAAIKKLTRSKKLKLIAENEKVHSKF